MRYKEVLHSLQNLTKESISQTRLADVLGYSVQTINKRAVRNSNFTIEELQVLEKAFNVELSKISTYDTDFYNVPICGEVHASMGSGITIYNENQTGTYKISRDLARDIGVNLNNTEMIFASGDSMLPTIEGGDSLLVDKSRTDIYDGRIYCVRIEGQLYAKRLQKVPPCTVVVISDNPKYKTFEIDFSKNIDFDFQVIGEIRWWGRVSR